MGAQHWVKGWYEFSLGCKVWGEVRAPADRKTMDWAVISYFGRHLRNPPNFSKKFMCLLSLGQVSCLVRQTDLHKCLCVSMCKQMRVEHQVWCHYSVIMANGNHVFQWKRGLPKYAGNWVRPGQNAYLGKVPSLLITHTKNENWKELHIKVKMDHAT